MKKVIWMFSGQGSQYYQMGRELFEQEPVFREYLEQGDAVVREMIHESVVDILYRPRRDRFEPFQRVLHTHPAILLVECALAQVLLRRGLQPHLMLGYSLGELASWVAAESISLDAALRVAVRQAELVEYCVPAGGMLAILEGLDLLDRCPQILKECEVAAVNFDKNFVITGRREAIHAAQNVLKEQGVRFIELPVAHPFHSRWSSLIATPCRKVLGTLEVRPPRWPLLSALRGGEEQKCDPLHLWDTTQARIDFAGRMRELEASGPYLYVDVGPAGSLATAVKYSLPAGSNSSFASVMTPFGQELRNIERLAAAQERFLSN